MASQGAMTKKLNGIRRDPYYAKIKIAERIIVETTDGMRYVFYKPLWSRAYKFSHRLIPEEGYEDGYRVNSDNRKLPSTILDWLDDEITNWEYNRGGIEFETVHGTESIIIKEEG